MSPGYLVSDSTRQRIEEVIRDRFGGDAVSTPQKQPGRVVVRVIAGAANAYGYPCYRQVWDEADEGWADEEDAVECRVIDDSGRELVEDDIVECRFVGFSSDGESATYRVSIGTLDVPDCSLSVPGKINLVNQKLGAGTKVVSSLGLGTDYADLVSLHVLSGPATFRSVPCTRLSEFTPDASEILGYTTSPAGIGTENHVVICSNNSARGWNISAQSVTVSGSETYDGTVLSFSHLSAVSSVGNINHYSPGEASGYVSAVSHGAQNSAFEVDGIVVGVSGVQTCTRFFTNDQGNISGSGAGTVFSGGYTPAFTKWYGVTVAGGIVTTGDTTVPTSALSGSISVANGGTGASSFSSGKLLYGNGTGAVQAAANAAINGSGQLELTTAGRTISFTSASF